MTLRGAFFTMLIKCKSFFIAIAILIRLLLSPPSGPRSPRSYFSFLPSFFLSFSFSTYRSLLSPPSRVREFQTGAATPAAQRGKNNHLLTFPFGLRWTARYASVYALFFAHFSCPSRSERFIKGRKRDEPRSILLFFSRSCGINALRKYRVKRIKNVFSPRYFSVPSNLSNGHGRSSEKNDHLTGYYDHPRNRP